MSDFQTMTNSDCLVIFVTGDKKPWYNSGGDGSNLSINPVGKGKGPKKPASKSRASAKSGPDIINPCFVPMSELCTDPFWRTTFIEASYGKFHRGFRYDNLGNNMTYKLKNKTRACNINDLTVYEAAVTIQKFMNDTAGIMSTIDVQNRTKHLNQLRLQKKEEFIDSWGKIKSDIHKQILICGFVTTMSEYYKLTEPEINQLSETIRLGVATKKFNLTNIQIDKGIVVNIGGLIRLPNGNFDIDPSIMTKPSKKKTYDKNEEEEDGIVYGKVNIMKKWNKLLDTLSKKGETKYIPSSIPNESISEPDSGSLN